MSTQEKVLVTGASGYIGKHTIALLLTKGYQVIGAVRTQELADKLTGQFSKKFPGSPLEIIVIPDIHAKDAFDKVLKENQDLKYAFDLACSSYTEFLERYEAGETFKLAGTINLLKAIKLYSPNFKKVVYTSSLGAIITLTNRGNLDVLYTEDSWNQATGEETGLELMVVHKAKDEQALWEFINSEKLSFGFTSIHPPLCLGPELFDEDAKLGQLHYVIQGLANIVMVPGNDASLFDHVFVGNLCADVRDIAKFHLMGLDEKTDNKRLLAFSGIITGDIMVKVVDEKFPQFSKNIDSLRERAKLGKAGPLFNVSNQKTIDLVGPLTYIPLETQLYDTISQIVKTEALNSAEP